MKRSLASRLVRLYPRSWRERYGSELEELLETEAAGVATLFDVARSAATQRLLNLARNGDREMQPYPAGVVSLVRKPSAFIPVGMSLCAFALVVGSIAMHGGAELKRQTDEGTAAHIWQLLMAGQLPILALFAFKWLRRDPKAGMSILALQMAGFGVALLPVWLLGL